MAAHSVVLTTEPPRNGHPLIDNIERWAEGRPQHLVT